MRGENKHITHVSGPWPRLIRLTALRVTDISVTRCVNIREEDIYRVWVRGWLRVMRLRCLLLVFGALNLLSYRLRTLKEVSVISCSWLC